MRILITHPYCWPYVRRGSERFLSELSRFLAQRGHEVTVLSTSPRGREEETADGVRIVREFEIKPPSLAGLPLVSPETGFALVCRRFLRQNAFDVIHCLHHADVLGAMWEDRARRTPCVFHITGIPFARWIRRRPWETAITRAAVRHAARVLLVSRHAADQFRCVFPRSAAKALSIAIPCQVNAFITQGVSKDIDRPTILFMGAATELRKGAYPLARAFNLVKQLMPGTQLRYCGNATDSVKRSILECVQPEFRDSVELIGNGRLEDLPKIYAEAAVTVLPSVEEAFGMVLVESLASGTPVVGSSDAGISDIISGNIGGLFNPKPKNGVAANITGLADQIVATVRLQADPSLAERCRISARRFEWARLGSEYENVYKMCVNGVPASV